MKRQGKIALWLLFFIVLMITFLSSPFSKVENIKVKGNSLIAEKEIIESSKMHEGMSLFALNKNEALNNIQKELNLKSVSVNYSFPNNVDIIVKEYGYAGYLYSKQEFIPVLSNGAKLEPLKKGEIPVDKPILLNFKDEKTLKSVCEALILLPEELTAMISEVHDASTKTYEYRVELFMNDGNQIIASSKTMSDKLVHYSGLVSQLEPNMRGVFHLEVGSYFRAYESTLSEVHENEQW